MAKHGTDQLFGGSIPLLYETHLVPLIFEPYARDLARTLAARALSNVLEVAAGTGVVTRALDATLPDHVAITATDLNQPMLDQAATVGTKTHRAMAAGRCDAVAVPRRHVRRRRLPVWRHVLSRPTPGVCASAPRAAFRRALHLQRMGSDRRKRICRHRDPGARTGVSCGSAALPRANAARLP